MNAYQLTEEDHKNIDTLEWFRGAVDAWSKSSQTDKRDQWRSEINKSMDTVREIVRLAGCQKAMNVSPPPAIGGLVLKGVDPFDHNI